MTTAPTTHVPTHRTEQEWAHYITMGSIRMYCLMTNCDGVHHVWCDCHTHMPHAL